MLRRIIISVIVGVAVTLACILVGNLLAALNFPVAVTVGNFLENYSGLIGVLAGLWYFFTNRVV